MDEETEEEYAEHINRRRKFTKILTIAFGILDAILLGIIALYYIRW